MLLISVIIALIALVIGSYTDFQKREVHDYVSFGLIFVAFAISVIYSLIIWDYRPFAQTTIGFLIGMGIAYAMFYLGQWGGGDSKLIMGLGAIFGFNVFTIFGENNLTLLVFFIDLVLVGALYGLIFSVYLAIKHRKEFMQTLHIWSNKKDVKVARIVLLSFVILASAVILIFVPTEFKLMILSIVALLFIVYYMWLFVKIIEESCMIKSIPVDKLTEGDWIHQDVFINKKYIVGPKDLGISKKQIAMLKRYKIRNIRVKEGIPFIPAFLLAFIMTLIMIQLQLPNILF